MGWVPLESKSYPYLILKETKFFEFSVDFMQYISKFPFTEKILPLNSFTLSLSLKPNEIKKCLNPAGRSPGRRQILIQMGKSSIIAVSPEWRPSLVLLPTWPQSKAAYIG